jgi:hypothetical protein
MKLDPMEIHAMRRRDSVSVSLIIPAKSVTSVRTVTLTILPVPVSIHMRLKIFNKIIKYS